MKNLGKITLLMIMMLSISVGSVYANTNKKEEKSEKDLWIKPSEFATDENSSKATVIENVDKDGKAIDVKKEEFIDVRQFVTFKTKSGKTLHLIIDHSKNNKNVRLLTEVSELDLLNMLEESERKKLMGDKKETVKKIEPKKEVEKPKESEKIKPEKKEDKKSSNSLYLIFGIFILIFVGAGYYFKVYKKKTNEFIDDEEDYDELEEDEYENVTDDENLDVVDDDIEVDNSEEDEDDE